MVIKHYMVMRGAVNTTDGIGHQAGTLVGADGLDADTIKALLADGTLRPLDATDTGKTPPKEPHPEQVEATTKVEQPTTRKPLRS